MTATRLVGGLYGVSLGRAFFGESMFHRARDASKIALVHLVARLRAGGYRLLDTQYVTDHLKTFGAVDVPKRRYHRLLEDALVGEADFAALPIDRPVSGDEALAHLADRSAQRRQETAAAAARARGCRRWRAAASACCAGGCLRRRRLGRRFRHGGTCPPLQSVSHTS